MAGWQSGYAAACKAVDVGSIPALASKFIVTVSESRRTVMIQCIHEVGDGFCHRLWAFVMHHMPASRQTRFP